MSEITLHHASIIKEAGDCVLAARIEAVFVDEENKLYKKNFYCGYSRGDLSLLGLRASGDEQKFFDLAIKKLEVEMDQYLKVLNCESGAS